MNVLTQHTGVPIKAWTGEMTVEPQAVNQLVNVASLPFIFKHVAVMPDVHLGVGATIGSVIPTQGAIIPAAVGVDIGCGMLAVRLNLTAERLGDSASWTRRAIEDAIPVGNGPIGEYKDIPLEAYSALNDLIPRYEKDVARHSLKYGNAAHQIGTLGGGNHFIELCLDESDRVWLMLHSGSRGLGNRIGNMYINLAKEDMRKFFVNLPDADLAYLPEGTDHFNDYVKAVHWAQDYAAHNREVMLIRILKAMSVTMAEAIVKCHHNYIGRENHFNQNIWVTRKGAVDASEGKLGIIPGSMGQRSYIVRGKGNAESFRSCSHGAGRAMSRSEARRRFTVEDLAEQTAGVECRKDSGVVDEIPSAYKDLDQVMAAQADLVEVVHTLKAVVTVKG
jgi:tRNA-splicing ligase RtcB